MLDLLRWKLGSKDVVGNLKGYGSNVTLPVFTPFGSKHLWWIGYCGNAMYVPPSRQLYDRYFEGKWLDFAQWRASPKEKHVLADFKRIGYHPPRTAPATKPKKKEGGSAPTK
jgi:hypothetical protein